MNSIIKENYSDFLNAWGIKEVIDVPIRKDEETLSNPSQSCHQNVAYMQMKFGGRTCLGFTINDMTNSLFIEPHSVWLTPENEYVDVSLCRLEENTIPFAPVKTFDASKEFYCIYERYSFMGDFMLRDYGRENEKHTNDFLKDKDFTSLVFHRDIPMTESDYWQDYLVERDLVGNIWNGENYE